MWTAIDKFLAALVTSGLLWLNNKYGFKFSTDPVTVAAISTFIVSAVVYFVPNLKKT